MKYIEKEISGLIQMFFDDGTCDLKNVSDIIASQIYSSIDFDIDKLLYALSCCVQAKINGKVSGFKNDNLTFDISRDSSSRKIYLKAFESKGMPFIYFNFENENLAFYKIKSVKVNGGLKISLNLNNNSDEKFNNKPHFVLNDDFIMINNKLIEDKSLDIQTNPIEVKIDYPDSVKEDINFGRFFEDFKALTSAPLSDESKLVIYYYFYNVIKNLLAGPDGFSFEDLLFIFDKVVNENGDKSGDEQLAKKPIIKEICDIKPENGLKPNSMFLKMHDDNSEVKNVRVVRSEKNIQLELSDENKELVCSYMICATDSGFTLYCTFNGFKKQNKNIPSFTLNLTDNKFRLFSLNNPKIIENLSPIDITFEIKEDGSIHFSSISKSVENLSELFENCKSNVENISQKISE